MAKDLVIRATLDSSGVEQGAKGAEKSLGQIKRQAELAAKGLKSLSNDSGLDAVKSQFSSLGQQIDKFSKKMTSGLGIKQQSRQISQQLAEVANVYRNMSSEEKASVAGQYLKTYMQELTVLGGKTADTVKDMQAQISAMASDTPIMAGLAEGVGLVADGFTIATGAAKALGVSEKKLADLQKQLTSLMAISNAAMNIKNALVNQGALKTALLNIQIRANALYTSLQAAAAGKATIAAKSAAVAQELWNKAIKANPIMFTIGLIGTAVGAIYALAKADDDAQKQAKKHADAVKEVNKTEEARKRMMEDMADTVASSVAKQLANYTFLQKKWKECGNDIAEQQKFLKDYRKELDATGFSIKDIADAQNVLVDQAPDVIEMYYALAEAAGAAGAAEDAFKRKIERKYKKTRENGGKYILAPDDYDKLSKEEKEYLGTGFSSSLYYNTNILGNPTTLTGEGKKAINKFRENQAKHLRETQDAMDDAIIDESLNAMANSQKRMERLRSKIRTTYSPSRTSSTRTTTTTTTKTEQAVKGSIQDIENQIKKLEDLMKNTVDQGFYQECKEKIAELEKEKVVLTFKLNYGSVRDAASVLAYLQKLANQLYPESTTKVPKSGGGGGTSEDKISKDIKVSDYLGVLPEKHREVGIKQANQDASDLLENTEKLRNGAEAAAAAFSALGNAIGGSAGKAIDVAGIMAGAIATMIEAYATAIAGAAKLGPWAWIAFGLTGLAQLAGMIATVKQLGTYAEGGIVQGNGSFYAMNDGVVLRSHQGEMLLNKQQQRTLFDRINNGFDNTGNGKVEFFISGRNLKGVLNNYNDKLGRL